jgi:putative transposase
VVSLFSSDLKWEVFYISCYSDQTTMFCFIRDLLQAIFKAVTFNRKNLIFALLMLRKQNEILKRQIDSRKERLQILSADCWSFAMIAAVSKPTISLLQIFKPETVLAWQRRLISRNWTFSRTEPGRKPVSAETKNLILNMKNDNSLWGCRRIADELGKLGIDIHHSTVNRIIQDFRKKGKITVSGSWSRFLKAHWDSLYGMDFMTIDTIFGKRLYLLIVLKLSTREIQYWDLTEYPTTEFVRQRIIDLQDKNPDAKYLIHDNAPQFTTIDYQNYGSNGVKTSVAAPNMNAFTERVIGTIRREALDHFLLFSERQAKKIVSEYIEYYNRLRPHQGIKCIPAGKESTGFGEIVKHPILSGLHHNYYRSSA